MALGVGLATSGFNLIRSMSWFYFSGISCMLEAHELWNDCSCISCLVDLTWLDACDPGGGLVCFGNFWSFQLLVWSSFLFVLMDVWSVWSTCVLAFSLGYIGLFSMCKSFVLAFAYWWSNLSHPSTHFTHEKKIVPLLYYGYFVDASHNLQE